MSLALVQVAGFGVVVVAVFAVIVLLFLIGSAVRIVNEYERGVIFSLGRIKGAKGPGLFFPAGSGAEQPV